MRFAAHTTRPSSSNAAAMMKSRTRVDPEFVVASPQVLDEGMTLDHDAGGSVSFEAPHRSEPGLEASVVGFDSVVGVLGGVVKCSRQKVGNDSYQGMGPVRGDLSRFAMAADRIRNPANAETGCWIGRMRRLRFIPTASFSQGPGTNPRVPEKSALNATVPRKHISGFDRRGRFLWQGHPSPRLEALPYRHRAAPSGHSDTALRG